MLKVHVTENENTKVCEVEITTPNGGTYTFWDDKINVDKRIHEKMVEMGF